MGAPAPPASSTLPAQHPPAASSTPGSCWRAAATAYAAAHARLAARRHGGRGAGTDSPPLPSLTAQQADELAAVAELAELLLR